VTVLDRREAGATRDSLPPILAPLGAPDLPPKIDYGIAIVGCGGIVNYGHMPAYKACSFRVVGCYDIDAEAAKKTAATHLISRVYPHIDDLLADREVNIVDIAVPAWEQRSVVREVAPARKHLLCQKPLADTYAHAVEIVRVARAAGVKLAVNQQLRWSPLMRALRILLDRGWIGQVLDVQLRVSINTPWEMWPWLRDQPRLEILFHSIHYVDSLRSLFGDPALVTSHHTRHPTQQARGETKTVTVWDYTSGLQVLIAACHYDWSQEIYSVLRVLGTEGLFEGTIGTNYHYPHGRNDTARFVSAGDASRNFEATLPGRWIPDAFYGPMASLMAAIQTGGEPATAGEDNLATLRAVEAAYRSATERRAVAPSEIVG
jgi:predicted dehydrogenase